MVKSKVLTALVERGLIEDVKAVRDRRVCARAHRSKIKEIASLMRSFGAHLSAITCVDLMGEFELIYHFDVGGCLLNLKVSVNRALPKVESIADIFPAADFYEREIMDLFGVAFEGHPSPERLILPDDWPQGVYPLRKR